MKYTYLKELIELITGKELLEIDLNELHWRYKYNIRYLGELLERYKDTGIDFLSVLVYAASSEHKEYNTTQLSAFISEIDKRLNSKGCYDSIVGLLKVMLLKKFSKEKEFEESLHNYLKNQASLDIMNLNLIFDDSIFPYFLNKDSEYRKSLCKILSYCKIEIDLKEFRKHRNIYNKFFGFITSIIPELELTKKELGCDVFDSFKTVSKLGRYKETNPGLLKACKMFRVEELGYAVNYLYSSHCYSKNSKIPKMIKVFTYEILMNIQWDSPFFSSIERNLNEYLLDGICIKTFDFSRTQISDIERLFIFLTNTNINELSLDTLPTSILEHPTFDFEKLVDKAPDYVYLRLLLKIDNKALVKKYWSYILSRIKNTVSYSIKKVREDLIVEGKLEPTVENLEFVFNEGCIDDISAKINHEFYNHFYDYVLEHKLFEDIHDSSKYKRILYIIFIIIENDSRRLSKTQINRISDLSIIKRQYMKFLKLVYDDKEYMEFLNLEKEDLIELMIYMKKKRYWKYSYSNFFANFKDERIIQVDAVINLEDLFAEKHYYIQNYLCNVSAELNKLNDRALYQKYLYKFFVNSIPLFKKNPTEFINHAISNNIISKEEGYRILMNNIKYEF